MNREIIISGIKCSVSGGVHQGSGRIYISTGDGRKSSDGVSLGFTKDEARRIESQLGGRVSWSSPTWMGYSYGDRVLMLSLYVTSDEIDDMFTHHLLSQLKVTT